MSVENRGIRGLVAAVEIAALIALGQGEANAQQSQDEINRQKIEQAKEGERIALKDARVTYLGKFTGNFIYSTVGTDESPASALLRVSDCVYDLLREKQKLGPELVIKGNRVKNVWRPNQTLDITGTVKYNGANIPLAILDLERVSLGNDSKECKKPNRGLNIDFRSVAVRVGDTVKDLIEGFEDGYSK